MYEQPRGARSLKPSAGKAAELRVKLLRAGKPRRGVKNIGRRWSAEHGTPAKKVHIFKSAEGAAEFCHPFGV